VKVQTGTTTAYPGGVPSAAPDPQQALLMALAERADVIVDFRGLANGTKIRMVNTAPDAPFGGSRMYLLTPDNRAGHAVCCEHGLNGASSTDPAGASPAADPWTLTLPAEVPLAASTVTRQVSLNELESAQVCVTVDPVSGAITVVHVQLTPDPNIAATCASIGAVPMAPQSAMLGTVDLTNPAAPVGIPLQWTT